MSGRQGDQALRVLVVGAGTRFLSAMSYYTIRLTNALAGHFSVAVVPMRRLIPAFLYPGRARVGSARTRSGLRPCCRGAAGYRLVLGIELVRDLNSLRRWRPDFVIFEWWTGTVLHTYLAIALLARLLGASIIVEFHEVLDPGEDRIPFARAWVSLLGRPFLRLASAFVIHSEADRRPLEKRYRLGARPCVVIPHGPLDHHASKPSPDGSASRVRAAPPDACNLLFFGIFGRTKGLRTSSGHSRSSTTTKWIAIGSRSSARPGRAGTCPSG